MFEIKNRFNLVLFKVYTHRIRHCKGNKAAWCLIALRDDGSEIDSYGGYTTAMTIDALLKDARGLLPTADDVVQIVYYSENETKLPK